MPAEEPEAVEGNPADDAEGMEGDPEGEEDEADGSPPAGVGEPEGVVGKPDEDDEEADGMDADELDDDEELDEGMELDEGTELEDCCWLVDSQPASAMTATTNIAFRTEYRLLLYIMVPCLYFRVVIPVTPNMRPNAGGYNRSGHSDYYDRVM